MSQQFLSRIVPALGVSLAVIAFAGSANATGGGYYPYQVTVSCPAAQEGNSQSFHSTTIQIRNITGRNNAFMIKSVKVYARDGTLIRNMPAAHPLPALFVKEPVAHSVTGFWSLDVLGRTQALGLTVVFDIQVNTYAQPFLITSIHRDLDDRIGIVSRTELTCIAQASR